MKIIVLEHERAVPAALLVDWASARGHAVSTLEVPALTRWPVPRDADAYITKPFDAVELDEIGKASDADAFVTLGSDRSVTDPSVPWLERELELLRSAHGAGVPLLGICFGAQALAKALGGEVRRAPQIALDWSTLETDEPELIARGPWLRWHEDILTVPPGARELARSGEVPLAFVHGACSSIPRPTPPSPTPGSRNPSASSPSARSTSPRYGAKSRSPPPVLAHAPWSCSTGSPGCGHSRGRRLAASASSASRTN